MERELALSITEEVTEVEVAPAPDTGPGRETPSEGLSPFLPNSNIQFAWDSTSLEWLKRCPRLYQYQMIDGWQPKGEGIHLRFGIEFHQALHDYEKCLAADLNHNDAVHDTIRELLVRTFDWKPEPRTKTEELKTKDNLVRTVIWYLDKYKDDPAKTVMMEGNKPAIEVSFRFELDFSPEQGLEQPYVLCGHLDRVVTFQDELFVMDRKTASTTPGPYYFDQYHPHNQMTLYTLASQVIFQAPIKGIIIDAAQVAVGFSRYVRGFSYRTEEQLTEWLRDLHYWLAQAEGYATKGYWPMNDTACDKYGGCRFRDICQKSPQVRETFLKSNFEKGVRWNPLKAR